MVRPSGFCKAGEQEVRREKVCLKFNQAEGNFKVVLVSEDDI